MRPQNAKVGRESSRIALWRGTSGGAKAIPVTPDTARQMALPVTDMKKRAPCGTRFCSFRMTRPPRGGTLYSASGPLSPVRTRMTSSIGETKILPSPIRSVRAAFTIAVDQVLHLVIVDDCDHGDLRQQVDDVLGAAPVLGDAALGAVALDLGDGQALVAEADDGLLDGVQAARAER